MANIDDCRPNSWEGPAVESTTQLRFGPKTKTKTTKQKQNIITSKQQTKQTKLNIQNKQNTNGLGGVLGGFWRPEGPEIRAGGPDFRAPEGPEIRPEGPEILAPERPEIRPAGPEIPAPEGPEIPARRAGNPGPPAEPGLGANPFLFPSPRSPICSAFPTVF